MPVFKTGEGISILGTKRMVSATFQRPNDTTAYAANDAVSDSTGTTTPMTFSNAVLGAGLGGYITKVRIVTDQSTNTATFKLWLYSSTPVTPAADNSPFTLLWSNRAIRIGHLSIGPLATEGTGSDSASALDIADLLPFVSVDGNLYGLLETTGAFTPAAQQNIYVELTIDVAQ